MILVKKLKFFHLLCFLKIDREKVFADVLLRKQAFLDSINMDFKKKKKIGIFAQGIVHDFRQKFEVFSFFVFIKNRSRKSVC